MPLPPPLVRAHYSLVEPVAELTQHVVLQLLVPVVPTLRMQLQPVFDCPSLAALDPGSGRYIPAICHDTGVWHGHFTP